jgi:hypothetical protein
MVCARFRGAKSYEPEARASESPETMHSLALRARIRLCATGSSQRSVFPLDASAPQSRIPGRDSGRHDPERPRRHSHAARQRDQTLLGIPLTTHSSVFPIGCGASDADQPVTVNSVTGCIHRAVVADRSSPVLTLDSGRARAVFRGANIPFFSDFLSPLLVECYGARCPDSCSERS